MALDFQDGIIVEELDPAGETRNGGESLESVHKMLEETDVNDLTEAAHRQHDDNIAHQLHPDNHSMPEEREVYIDDEAQTVKIRSPNHESVLFVPIYTGHIKGDSVQGIIPTSDEDTMIIDSGELTDGHFQKKNAIYDFVNSQDFQRFDPEEMILSLGRHSVKLPPAILNPDNVTDQMQVELQQQLEDSEDTMPGVTDSRAPSTAFMHAGSEQEYGFIGEYGFEVVKGDAMATFEVDRAYELEYSVGTDSLSITVENIFSSTDQKNRVFEEVLEYASSPENTDYAFDIGTLDTGKEALVYLQDNENEEIDIIGAKSYSDDGVADIKISDKAPTVADGSDLRSAIQKEIIDEGDKYMLGASLAEIAVEPQRGRILKKPAHEANYKAAGKTVELRDFCAPKNEDGKKLLKKVHDFNHGEKQKIRVGYEV